MSERIKAPFTPDQVTVLNAYQQAGLMHPFTCSNHRAPDHGAGCVLVATVRGWVCPYCDYTQDWAHTFMATKQIGDLVQVFRRLNGRTGNRSHDTPIVEGVSALCVTGEQLLECLMSEYQYWRRVDQSEDDDAQRANRAGICIGAVGAVSNVIAYATVSEWGAEWHPEKPPQKSGHLPGCGTAYRGCAPGCPRDQSELPESNKCESCEEPAAHHVCEKHGRTL
jgi:hypothetical protein